MEWTPLTTWHPAPIPLQPCSPTSCWSTHLSYTPSCSALTFHLARWLCRPTELAVVYSSLSTNSTWDYQSCPRLRSLRMHRPEDRVCAKGVEVEMDGRRGLRACEFQGVKRRKQGPCRVGVWVWMELQDTSVSVTTSLKNEATLQHGP